jgi:hypothetical protein
MAWFRNHYVCLACEGHWIAEGDEVLEADCPHCRAYDVAPYRSDDLAVTALKAVAVKMRRAEDRPVRFKGRGAARVAVH